MHTVVRLSEDQNGPEEKLESSKIEARLPGVIYRSFYNSNDRRTRAIAEGNGVTRDSILFRGCKKKKMHPAV